MLKWHDLYHPLKEGTYLMRILIIGGTRFIGPPVVRYLSEQGHDITLIHRGQTHADLPRGVKEILAERRPLSTSADELRRLAPDIVLDMIPLIEQDAREIMNTFAGIAHRIIAISSQDVYRAFGLVNRKESDPPDPLPITEDSPLRENLYPYRGETPRKADDPRRWMEDYDKILVERLVMSDPDLPGTVLRLPAVYGPGDYQHRLFQFLKRMDDNRSAILLDEDIARWRWTHGYVENVASAIAWTVTNDRASGRIYNVGEPYTFTMAEWVTSIGHTAGWKGKIVTVPKDHLPAHLVDEIDTSQDIVVDTTRIRTELGYNEPIDLDEALRRTIAWERTHPPEMIDPKEFDYAAEDAVLSNM
jgi:nucleoside-diphosphate-sugar epimerase